MRRLALLLLAVPVLLHSGRAPVSAAASDARWRSVPLDGGAISGLGASAGEPAAVWATTPLSGVFRSLDGGRTWSRSPTAPSPRALLAGVDPRNGDRAFVMFLDPRSYDYTQLNFFMTTDGGATWSRASQGLGRHPYVYEVAFDPVDPDIIYAATSRGLHRSEDGGRSWTRLWEDRGVFAVTVAPDDPRLLLISILDRVYRSTDGGATFTEVSGSGMDRGIVFDPHDPNRVYGTSGPLFRSTDRGLTWEWIGRKFQFGFESVTVGQDGTLYGGSPFGVIRSFDGGTTFSPAATPDFTQRRPDDSIGDVVPLANGDVLAAGIRGVWRLSDGEHGWTAASEGIRGLTIAGLAMTAGGRLLASVPLNGVFHSDDAGGRFQISDRGLRTPYGTLGLRLIPSPSDPRVVYGSSGGNSHVRSDDAGVHWRSLALPNPAPLVTVLAVHPTNPEIVYAGGDEYNPREDYGKCHALRSRDGGVTWDCLEGSDLYTLTALVIDPQRPRRLFALDFIRFMISDDEGDTWREAGRGLPTEGGYYASALAIDARGRLFVGTGDGHVLRSLDAGETFSRVSRNLPRGTIQGLIVDPLRPDTLYALVYGQGVFRSRDGGRRWERLDTGLPVARFTGVATLDAERGLLFAGTEGRGLFVLDVR